MSKIWQVARQEMRHYLGHWSFYLSNLFSLGMITALAFLPEAAASVSETEVWNSVAGSELLHPTGLVDEAGVVQVVPPDMAADLFLYGDEGEAAAAIRAGEIDSYYIIPEDFQVRGRVTEFSPSPQLIGQSDGAIRRLIQYNALQQLDDPVLTERLLNPVTLQRTGPEPSILPFLPNGLPLDKLATAGLVFFLFTSTINTNGYLLVRALNRESQYRLLEVMITSLTPTQLIGGKLLGITLVGFMEIVPYFAVLGLVYQRDTSFAPAPIPLPYIPLFLLFLMVGYIAMSGLMLAVAAAFPKQGLGMVVQFLFRLSSWFPLVGGLIILLAPESWLAVLLSTFPLTAHILMPFRLLLIPVPLWQMALSPIGLVAWALFCLWFSTRLFRAYTLLTGQWLSWQTLKAVFRS
jgi:ABC-2 type transport system permease protein